MPKLIGHDAPSVKKVLTDAVLKPQFQLGVGAPPGVAPCTVYVQTPAANSSLATDGKVVVTIYAVDEVGAGKLADERLAKVLAEDPAKQSSTLGSNADQRQTDNSGTTQPETVVKGPSQARREKLSERLRSCYRSGIRWTTKMHEGCLRFWWISLTRGDTTSPVLTWPICAENPPKLGFFKVTYGRLYRPSGPSM